MKKWFMCAAAIFALTFALASCGEDKAITATKKARLDAFPQKTIGEAVKGFLADDTEWNVSRADSDRLARVSCEGSYLDDGVPSRLCIEFLLDEGTGSLSVSDVSSSGVSFGAGRSLAMLGAVYGLSDGEVNDMIFEATVAEAEEVIRLAKEIKKAKDTERAQELYGEFREHQGLVQEYTECLDESLLTAEQMERLRSLLWDIMLLG